MIRLCILDHDAHYAQTLADFFSVRCASQVEPCLFRSAEALREYLADHRLDLVLASPELLPEPGALPSCTVAYLCEEREMERFNGCPAVFRYQRGESLLRQIRSIAAESDRRNAVYTPGKRGALMVFLGAGGGTGCSAAAAGCAAQLARTGRKVLYLCLQNNGYVDDMLSGAGNGGMTRVLYEVKTFMNDQKGKGNLVPRLEGLLKYDPQLQVHYYEPFSLPVEAASMGREEAAGLLEALKGMFEVVVADADGVYTPVLKTVLGLAERVLPVSSGTKSSNCRMKRLLDTFSVLDEGADARILPRVRIVYNRFGSGARRLDDARAPVLTAISNFAGSDDRRIVREICAGSDFLPLLED